MFAFTIHKSKIILTLILCVTALHVTAQKSKVEGLSDSTELVNTRIESITFNSKPRVAMPEPDLSPPSGNLTYQPVEVHYKPKIAQPELKVKMLDKPVWEKLQNNFVKAGFGLYLTPLLKVGIYSGRDLRKDWGAEFDHFSSFGGHVPYATFGDNAIRLKGRYLANGHTFSSNVSFRNFGYNAFGMQRDETLFKEEDDWKKHIARNYSQLNVEFGVKKQPDLSAKFLYDAFLRVQNYSDGLKNNEFFFSVLPSVKMKLADSLWVNVGSNITFGSVSQPFYNQGQARSAIILDLAPQITYRKGMVNASAGFRVNAVNDTLKTHFNIYPILKAELHVLPPFCTIYAGLEGRSIFNRRYDMAEMNPWMDQRAFLRPTFEKIKAFGGIKGSYDNFSYDVQVFYRKVQDQWMFIASNRDTTIESQAISQGQFALLYEKDFTEIGTTIQANYDIEKNLQIGLKADYSSFTLPNVKYYFHQPNLRVKAWGKYTYAKKLTVGAGIHYIGKRVVNTDANGQPVYLDGFFDVNLEGSYKVSSRISIFVEVNNLLNQSFQRWQFYPERKIDLRAGAFISF